MAKILFMKRYLRFIFTFFVTTGLCILLSGSRLRAQDFHLSQYDITYQYTNPAMTGMYVSPFTKYRLAGDYRSQWRGLGNGAFTTSFVSFDTRLDEKFGVGGYLVNSRAGASGFNNFHFMVSGAYQLRLDEDNKNIISLGLQAGALVKSFDPSEYTFDNQYSASAGGFDTRLSSGESFEQTTIANFDANAGIFYRYNDFAKFLNPFAGIAVYHLTHPKESFYGRNNRLPLRYTLYAGADMHVSERLTITPRFLGMYQAGIKEINPGVMLGYHIQNTKFEPLAGFNYRLDDAVVLQAGLKHGESTYKISYDINTSYINSFQRNGALEFAFIYTGI